MLALGVVGVLPVESVEVGEHGGRLLEADAVLGKIARGLGGVPGKHLMYIH